MSYNFVTMSHNFLPCLIIFASIKKCVIIFNSEILQDLKVYMTLIAMMPFAMYKDISSVHGHFLNIFELYKDILVILLFLFTLQGHIKFLIHCTHKDICVLLQCIKSIYSVLKAFFGVHLELTVHGQERSPTVENLIM